MDEKNRALHRGLMSILDKAEHPLMVKELPAFSAIYNWTKTLPENMIEKPSVNHKKTSVRESKVEK